MNYIIWGAGLRGKEIFEFLGEDKILVFIESNCERVGTYYCGKRIIDFDEYLKVYNNCFIIISMLNNSEIITLLKKNEIHHYFILDENPSELYGLGTKNLFKEVIWKYEKEDMIGIYGLTLFGLLLYKHLEKCSFKNIYLIPHKGCDERLIVKIKEISENYNIEDLPSAKSKLNWIFLVYEDDAIVENNTSYKVENYYDFSDRIPSYNNNRIAELKNIHADRTRCFIIATGPSLTIKDLNTLKRNQEVTISMNSIFTVYKDTDWRSDYYVVVDGKIIEQCENEICDLEAKVKIVSDRYMPFWDKNKKEKKKNILKIHLAAYAGFYRKRKFSENLNQKVYTYGTVTYACIQLAVYLGFREIVLLGVDFNYTDNQSDTQNHINGGDFNIKNPNRVSYERSLIEYKWAKSYAEENNIKIFNATRGGKLEVFERINFDNLF